MIPTCMLQDNVQHWKQLRKKIQLNSLMNKYITIYDISQEIAHEINFETNMNKTHVKGNHCYHLRIRCTKVMKNTGFFIKKKHLYRFCIRWHILTHKLLKKESKIIHNTYICYESKNTEKDRHALLKKKYWKKS